jgi:hypothetical protein
MSTDHECDGYQTFFLRLWRARCRGRWQWRVAIESPGTGERRGFPTLAEFFVFLKDKARQETARSGVDGQDVDRGCVPYAEEERHDV